MILRTSSINGTFRTGYIGFYGKHCLQVFVFFKKKATEKANKTLKAIQSEMEWVNNANFNILKFFL